MISIELNLLCEGINNCSGACITSEPVSDINDALASVMQEAIDNGWKIIIDLTDGKIKAYCPDCLEQ